MQGKSLTVRTVERPYIIRFHATGTAYPISSEDAQRLLDSYPLLARGRNRVTLRGDDGYRVTIIPATIGGGDAFEVSS